MLKYLLILCFLLTCSAAWGFSPAEVRGFSDAALFKQVRIYSCGPAEMDSLLPELQRRFPAFDDRVRAIAGLYLSAPSITDPLIDETKNWLPYKAPNCTMLVLYVHALANSSSMAEAREHMRLMHYRGGKVGFRQRYHFTEDRITDPANRYFEEATAAQLRSADTLRPVTLELNRKQDGSLLFGKNLGNWTKKITLAYIPRAGFSTRLLAPMPPVMGVAFVKKENWNKGLIVGHEGLLINGDLYHCSSKHGVVVEKSYLSRGFLKSAWEGLLFFRLAAQDIKTEKKG